MNIQTIKNVPERPEGIIFWWSNILRVYQLRAYLPSGPQEPEIHLTRAEALKSAEALAKQHNLAIYEIDILPITDALSQ